jgi:hypothetical protein
MRSLYICNARDLFESQMRDFLTCRPTSQHCLHRFDGLNIREDLGFNGNGLVKLSGSQIGRHRLTLYTKVPCRSKVLADDDFHPPTRAQVIVL